MSLLLYIKEKSKKIIVFRWKISSTSLRLFFECEIPLREETENDGDESGEHF